VQCAGQRARIEVRYPIVREDRARYAGCRWTSVARGIGPDVHCIAVPGRRDGRKYQDDDHRLRRAKSRRAFRVCVQRIRECPDGGHKGFRGDAGADRNWRLSGGSATASSANRAFKKAEDDFIEATLAAEDTKEAEQTANTAVDGQKKALDAVKGDSEKTKVEQAKLDDLTAKQKAAAAARRQADERLKLRKSDYERAKTGAFVAVGGGASADAGGPISVVVRQSAQSTKELADAVANIVSAVIGTGFGDEDCNTLLTSPLLQTTSLALEAYLRKCAGLSPAEAKRAVADTGVQEAVKDAVNKIQTMRFFTLP